MTKVNDLFSCDSQQRRRVLVILNPMAGRRHGRLLARVIETLSGMGALVEVVETAAAGDARAIAAARAGDADVLAVAGGDGTINEAVNGLGAGAPPLGIIPLGTANVLAIEIGLALRPEAIARTIVSGPSRPVYTGAVNGRRFVMMAGIGLDAHVVETVDPDLKRRFGKAAYVWRTATALLRYPFPRFAVTLDGRRISASSVIVANGRHYGGSFVCAPEAALEMPALIAVAFTRFGAANASRYALALVAGCIPRLADVPRRKATRIEVAGPPGEPIQADGELVGRLPATITLCADPLRLLHPPPAAAR